LAGFAVSAAVSFALFPKPVFVFTGTSQFLALAATSTTPVVYADAARTNLNRLGEDRGSWNYKKSRCSDHEGEISHYIPFRQMPVALGS